MGLQNDRYVGLTPKWVKDNIDQDVLDEALRRGKALLMGDDDLGQAEQFVRLPPRDARSDDPPVHLRNTDEGLNYYYHNCLLGGFANAVFKMYGDHPADDLLLKWSPSAKM